MSIDSGGVSRVTEENLPVFLYVLETLNVLHVYCEYKRTCFYSSDIMALSPENYCHSMLCKWWPSHNLCVSCSEYKRCRYESHPFSALLAKTILKKKQKNICGFSALSLKVLHINVACMDSVDSDRYLRGWVSDAGLKDHWTDYTSSYFRGHHSCPQCFHPSTLCLSHSQFLTMLLCIYRLYRP